MIRARHVEAQAEQAWGVTLVTLPRRASVRLVRRLGAAVSVTRDEKDTGTSHFGWPPAKTCGLVLSKWL